MLCNISETQVLNVVYSLGRFYKLNATLLILTLGRLSADFGLNFADFEHFFGRLAR